VQQFLNQVQQAVADNLCDNSIDGDPWRALEGIVLEAINIARTARTEEHVDIKPACTAIAALAYFVYKGADNL
jgi:hypothetical protein